MSHHLKILHTSQPVYLSELISHYLPPRSLRSSNTNLLTRPAGITSNFSSRAFFVSAPSTWNLYLHTFILSIPYPPFNVTQNSISSSLPLPSSHPVPAPQIRSHDFCRYLNLYLCMYVCMYVRRFVTSRYCIETDRRIEIEMVASFDLFKASDSFSQFLAPY